MPRRPRRTKHRPQNLNSSDKTAGDCPNFEQSWRAKWDCPPLRCGFVAPSKARNRCHDASRQSDPVFPARALPHVGIEPRNRHGQNFLIDLNLVGCWSIRPADPRRRGAGNRHRHRLADRAAGRAGGAVSRSKSIRDAPTGQRRVVRPENVTLLSRTRCATNTSRRRMLAAVGEQLAPRPRARFKLAANLPYNVATPISDQSAGVPHAAGNDDRHDSKGAGRADHGARPARRITAR